jgi:phage gp29-like protein
MKKGIWVSQTEYLRFGESDRPLSQEIATRNRSIDFTSLGMYLPNPDPVLKKLGKDVAVYKELLGDAHLGGCVTSRKAGTKSREWAVDRNKSRSKPAKVIEAAFRNLDIDRIVGEMLDAPLFGYRVMEVLWESSGGYLLPRDVVGKPPQWFVFDEEARLRFRTKQDYIRGEAVPDRKFLVVSHEADYENPYGFPALSRCFWPVTFKKGGIKFWVIFSEKYGMPYLVGKHPRGATTGEINKLLDMLENMVQDAIAVVPEDAEVDIKEAGGKAASADIYEKLLSYCKGEISIALLGQNLTTEVKGGSFAATTGHMEVRQDVVDGDRRLVEGAFNHLISWIYEMNFAGGERPVFSLYEEEDVDAALADRDSKLMSGGQVRFTKKYFQKAYGFDEEDIEIVPPAPPQPFMPAFAESAGDAATADLVRAQEAVDGSAPEGGDLAAQSEKLLAPVIEMLQKGRFENIEQAMGSLAEIFPKMDDRGLQEMLARSIFVGKLWGRLKAGERKG